MPRLRVPAAGLLVVIAAARCNSTLVERPSILPPLEYPTVHVDLPGCEVILPPVHDVRRCSPDEIGVRIDAGEVCRLLSGLKAEVESGRPPFQRAARTWTVARSSCVYDAVVSGAAAIGRPARRVLTLYVDVPERSEVWFAQSTEGTATPDYFVSPR